jgi:prevent-host-death family protein
MEVASSESGAPTRIEVGVAELRAQLSRYLTQVRQGTEIVVTDHGHPIAYIGARHRTRLDEMIAQGRARPPMRRRRTTPEAVEYNGSLDDVTRSVQSQRR